MDINYKELFEHVRNLRKVVLVAGGGRVGSDFFHSLLDGHSEILQVTGSWFFHLWWKGAKCKKNLTDLIDEFIWYTGLHSNHIAKFKSYYEKMERWDQLGANKNDFFEVDIGTFKNHMMNILADREVNSKNFFLAVNLAYGLATNIDIRKTKILFYNIHHIRKLKAFKKDFPEFDVICSIRDPRSALVSSVEHWRRHSIESFDPMYLFKVVTRLLQESEPILKYTKRFKTLKLEDVHLFTREVLTEFCRTYGLELEDAMFESSFHGKKWWGDALSGRYLDGFNKNIRKETWKRRLPFHDRFLIEFILEDRMRHYGYLSGKKMPKIYLIFASALVFLPMKYEIDILSHTLRNGQGAKGEAAAPGRGVFFYMSQSVFFYLSRVFMYFRFIRKKIIKKIFLADFITRKT